MILLRKHTLIFLILCLLVTVIKSQESPIFHSNFFGISLSELAFVDIRVSYERKINPSHGIKLELSYKPVFKIFTDATIIDLGQSSTAWCYRNTAKWYYLAFGYRYYLGNKKTFYLSPEIFYKTLMADNIIYSYGLEAFSSIKNKIYQLRSMNADIVGINLLIGKKITKKISDGFNMGIDIFMGISLRSKKVKTTFWGSTNVSHYHDSSVRQLTIPCFDEPVVTKVNIFQVSPQFGIILFVSWK